MAPSKIFIIIFTFYINRCFFYFLFFSGNGRYEDPLSGLYLEMSISCLSTDKNQKCDPLRAMKIFIRRKVGHTT